MAGNGLFLEPLDHIGKPVARRIDVGIVDLVRIAGQHHLRALARPGDDGLDLVGRQVLRLVHDEVLVRHAPASYVGERLHLDHAQVKKALDVLPALAPRRRCRGSHQKIEIVADRLHPGLELLVDVAGQEADVLPERKHGAGDHQALVDAGLDRLFEPCSQRQERFAGSGLSHERHEPDIIVQQQVQGELLLLVPRRYPPDAVLHVHDRQQGALLMAVPGKRCLGLVRRALEHHELVRVERAARQLQLAFGVKVIELPRLHVLLGLAAVQLLDRDRIGLEVLGMEPHGVGLDPQVRVFRHQDDGRTILALAQVQGRGQDAVVALGRHEFGRQALRRLMVQLHPQAAAAVERNAFRKLSAQPVFVQDPRNLARVPPHFVDAFFEPVQLLDHDNGDHHVIIVKGKYGAGIVEQHIRVEHKGLLHAFFLIRKDFLYLLRYSGQP